MTDAEIADMVRPIVAAVRSRIEVPMDTRPFGGRFEGILLSSAARDAVEEALTAALKNEFLVYGPPQLGTSGADIDYR